jgi:hypothetical protein
VQVNGGESFRFSVNEGEQLGNRVRHTGPPPCRHEITPELDRQIIYLAFSPKPMCSLTWIT